MKKTSLLYVDDEPINLKLFKLNFDKHFDLYVAENGMEGLELIKEHDIPIIVTDYKMPEMNGVEFIDAVKKIKSSIVCFILSAYEESEIRGFSQNPNAIDGFISKPWKRDIVLHLIQDSYKNKKQ